MTRGSQFSRSKIHRIYSNAKFKLNISDKEILEKALFCLAWNTWSAVFRSVIPFPPWKVWIVASIIIHTLHVELNYAGKSTYQKNRWQAENEVLSMNSEPFKNLTSAITSFAHKPDDMQRLYTIICSTWSVRHMTRAMPESRNILHDIQTYESLTIQKQWRVT